MRLLQQISPAGADLRMEGVGFSTCGRLMAVATSDANRILVFRRRKPDSAFETEPACVLADAALVNYPHDVSFSPDPASDMLAVAQRSDSLLIYRRQRGSDIYGPAPAALISGEETQLRFSDGVAFLPPHGRLIAACNLLCDSVSFYRVDTSGGSVDVVNTPVFVLTHDCIRYPDGLAFSATGKYLALANHGDQSVAIFRIETRADDDFEGPEAMLEMVIRDPLMKYPHSVAFTPHDDHLLVTNAGANFISVYHCDHGAARTTWSRRANTLIPVAGINDFHKVNCGNKMEGGPKGIATWRDQVVVCSPQVGARLMQLNRHMTPPARLPVYGVSQRDRPGQSDRWREIPGGHGALLLEHTGHRAQVRLDGLSASIWRLCRARPTVNAIVESLQITGLVSANRPEEVIDSLQALERRGLIQL